MGHMNGSLLLPKEPSQSHLYLVAPLMPTYCFSSVAYRFDQQTAPSFAPAPSPPSFRFVAKLNNKFSEPLMRAIFSTASFTASP